jgi:hypothetical protein
VLGARAILLSVFLWMQFKVPLDSLVLSRTTDSTTFISTNSNKTISTLVSPPTTSSDSTTYARIGNNEPTTTTTTKHNNMTISILVELTGELGNHLHHLAHGRAIQRLAMSEYGISTRLVLHRSSNAEKTAKRNGTCDGVFLR